MNSASRVGKWCWAAPRETPACSATTATVLALQPSSARQVIADSSSRARVARRPVLLRLARLERGHLLGRPPRRPLLQEREHALARLLRTEQPGRQRLHLVGALGERGAARHAVVSGLVSASPCGEQTAQGVGDRGRSRRRVVGGDRDQPDAAAAAAASNVSPVR